MGGKGREGGRGGEIWKAGLVRIGEEKWGREMSLPGDGELREGGGNRGWD